MSLYGGSVFSRLSKRSAIRDKSQLAVHLSNDNAMRRLLRDGVGINELQKKYLSLCYSARPGVRPNKDVAVSLGMGELVWNLTACEKPETAVVASLLTTKEARSELRSLVISAREPGCSSVRERAGKARASRRGAVGSRGGPREMIMERDPTGEMELFLSLCKALPHLDALRNLELEGLTKAFEKSGGGAARLARGLAGNSKLKSLAVRRVRLTDARALGVMSSAIGGHPSLVALSLRHCGLTGKPSGSLVSSVIRAHAARREGMVWSAGLRRPDGVVGHTAAAAPARISTAGCLAVDLSGNRLGDTGVHAVARGLQSDTWLLGLNLADNEITDHGATLLSVCLRHNSTLCALVLDGNPGISQQSESRITRELETRSMMPEAVLEEPELVLTLASWGFSAHASFEGGLPAQPPPGPPAAVENESAVSDISQDSSGGGGVGGVGMSGRATRNDVVGDAFAMYTKAVPSKTLAERKEETVREFRRWAGYSGTHQSAADPPLGCSAGAREERAAGADVATATTAAYYQAIEATMRRPRGRERPSTSLLLRGGSTANPTAASSFTAAGPQADEPANRSRARARSLSSRSRSVAPAARTACCPDDWCGTGGRLTKRNKSSGPLRRRVDHHHDRHGPRTAAGVRAGALANGTGGRGVHRKTPWGAGPANTYARDRAQAWAESHLVNGEAADRSRISAGAGSRRSRVRSRRGHVGSGGCGGGHRKVRKRSSKSISGGRLTAGSRRTSRFDSNVNPPGRGEIQRQPREGSTAAQDVTWSILDAEDRPEQSPRHRRNFDLPSAEGPMAAATGMERSVVSSSTGGRGGATSAGGGGRTDRLLEMLQTLEQAVMDVCKDMWRLEDKVENSARFNARGGMGRASQDDAGTGRGGVRRREDEQEAHSGNNGDDDFEVRDRDEVAAQVEACLREMWRDIPGAATHRSTGGSGGTSAAAAAAAPAPAGARATGASFVDGSGSNIISGSSTGMAAADLASRSEEGPGSSVDERNKDYPVHAALLSTNDCGDGDSGGGGGGGRGQGAPGDRNGAQDRDLFRSSEVLEWRRHQEEGMVTTARMEADAGHVLQRHHAQDGVESKIEETRVRLVEGQEEAGEQGGNAQEGDRDDERGRATGGGAGGAVAENPAPAGVGGKGWRPLALLDEEGRIEGGGRIQEDPRYIPQEQEQERDKDKGRRGKGACDGASPVRRRRSPFADDVAVSSSSSPPPPDDLFLLEDLMGEGERVDGGNGGSGDSAGKGSNKRGKEGPLLPPSLP